MEHILDTDTCIYWLKGREEIRDKAEKIGADNLRITIITLAELKYGAYNSQKVSENLESIGKFLRKVRVLSFDHDAAERFGKIKADLRKSGQIIQDFDILIASIVMSHKGVLVTNNIEHFSRISELNYENWLQK
ncbi:MAG: type II toxin-antitoxin system VapC family toxin [Deltaproteobacteria bacterium]|nr:type II toxin-antitoxin system VapC family toxin [Deltaproteobacteria bacterium]